MTLLARSGKCDCHSHVFGPFATYPLSESRTFDPAEAPIDELEGVWAALGIERAVLVQGSAHGRDPGALLDAIARSPVTRRGVVLLDSNVLPGRLAALHEAGIRAVRFNWTHHLLGTDTRSHAERFADASTLLERIAPFGWHVELHIDAGDLHVASQLPAPAGMPIVIDHMARINMADPGAPGQLAQLLKLLESERFWVKLSGADRLAAHSTELNVAREPMRAICHHAADRCVWGLDWPHVNLQRRRSDSELAEFVQEAAADEGTLEKVLVTNAARLYGFEL